VTKSVVALLLGIALGAEAEAAVQQPLPSFFPGRTDMNPALEAVTLHHVLTMTAGLDWNELEVPYTDPTNDEIRLYGTDDPLGLVLARPLREPPGTRWAYSGGLTQVVAAVLEAVTEQPMDAFARARLFDPLGIADVSWSRPSIWPASQAPAAASGLRMSPRSLARIGELVRERGRWQGEQIVPEAWVARATDRHVADTPWGPPGAYGYGYFWFPGTLHGGLRVIRAVGNGDQRLFVIPDLDLTLTVLCGNYDDVTHVAGDRILAYILGAAP